MDNMRIYNRVRAVPKEAIKPITAGRLKGMSDINPLWRIQTLTELFGPCGQGWKYIITRREFVPGANDECACFVDIDLYYRLEDGSWSEAVPGTGGSSYIANERNGLYTSDEAGKMALTDALSVACKALGIGADVYWAAGRSKYSPGTEPVKPAKKVSVKCESCKREIGATPLRTGEVWAVSDIAAYSQRRFGHTLCPDCQKKMAEDEKRAALMQEAKTEAENANG